MKHFERKCPKCDKTLTYTLRKDMRRANKKNSVCSSCFQRPKHRFSPNQQFGCFTILTGDMIFLPTPNKQRKYKRVIAVKCSNCGTITESSPYQLTKYPKSCAHCVGKNHHLWEGCGEVSGHYYSRLKRGALSRNLTFDISVEFLWRLFSQQKGLCALTNVPITIRQNQKHNVKMGLASLDRIDSNKGYVDGNVQWVDSKVNFMKQSFSENEFISLCQRVVKTAIRRKTDIGLNEQLLLTLE